MNNNLNNFKIKNPFGKFLRNIFLGVLLLIISFGGALLIPNKNSQGVDANTSSSFLQWSIHDRYKGNNNGHNWLDACAYTTIAREYDENGNKYSASASSDGKYYGSLAQNGNYYAAVYYNDLDAMVTARATYDIETPENPTAAELRHIRPDVWYLNGKNGGVIDSWREYIDYTPWAKGYNFGQNGLGLGYNNTAAAVAYNPNKYKYIGYQCNVGYTFYNNGAELWQDSDGLFRDQFDRKYQYLGAKYTGRTNYSSIKCLDNGETYYVNDSYGGSIYSYLAEDYQLYDSNLKSVKYNSETVYLVWNNSYKAGVLPTSNLSTMSWTSDSNGKRNYYRFGGFVKANRLNNGELIQAIAQGIKPKGYGSNIVTVMSGRSESVSGGTATYSSSIEDEYYRNWDFYTTTIAASSTNWVFMLQSTNTKNIYLYLNGGDSRNGSASSVTLRQYDYYPRLTAIPTKAGYKFKGYYTSTSGGTQMYTADGRPTRAWDGNTSISGSWYAQWELASYTINYNSNGGTGSISSQTVKFNAPTQLKVNTFSKTGYTFNGWKVTSGLDSNIAVWASTNSACSATNTANIYTSTRLNEGVWVKKLTGVVDGSVTLSAQWIPNTYTINFDSGGGEGEMTSQSAIYGIGANIKLKANAFTKVGYVFDGWLVTSGLNTVASAWCGADKNCPTKVTSSTKIGDEWYVENLTPIDDGSVTLTAQWQIAKHSLTIDFSSINNIYGSVDGLYLALRSVSGITYTPYTTAPNKLTYITDYNATPLTVEFYFYSLNSDNSISTDEYYISLNNGTYSGIGSIKFIWTPTSDLTYTAKIYKIYTISAEAGTGVQTVTVASGTSGFESNKVKHGDSATFTATKKLGYDTFDGWYNGTTKVSSGLSYTKAITADTTLTAKSTPNTYTISYNANGGSGSMISSEFTYDTASYLRSNSFIAPTGKVFRGWATTSTGEVVYSNGQSVKNLTATNKGTITLYAVWGEPSSVTDGLVMNLSKWSATSSKWYDITGNGYDMTMTRGTPCVKGGYIYNSISYYGKTKALNLTDSVTLEATVTTGSASSSVMHIMGNYLEGGYALRSTSQKFQFIIRIDGVDRTVTATSTWTINTIYHLVGTYDGSSIKLYINGSLSGSLPVSGTITTPSNSTIMGVGALFNGSSYYGCNYTGSIHKAKVFNRALTASEITIEQNIADYSVSYAPNDGRNTNLWNYRNIASSSNTTVVSKIVDQNTLIFTGSTLTFTYQGSTQLSKTTSGNYSCSFTYDAQSIFIFGATSTNINYSISSLTKNKTYTLSFTASLSSTTWTITKIKLEEGDTKTDYSEPMQNVSFGDPYFWLYNNKTYTPKTGYVFNGWKNELISSTIGMNVANANTLTLNKTYLLSFNNDYNLNTLSYWQNGLPATAIMRNIAANATNVKVWIDVEQTNMIQFTMNALNKSLIDVDSTDITPSTIHNVAKNVKFSAYVTQDESIANYKVELGNHGYYFDNLQDAVTFCYGNDLTEIVILKNVAETTTVTINTDVTLKAQDSSCGITFNGGALTVATGKTLTIDNGTYSQTSTSTSTNLFNLTGSNAGSIVVNGGKFTTVNVMFNIGAGNVTINNGEFTNTSTSSLISVTNSGKFIINSGNYTSNSSQYMIINAQEINGGNFTNTGSGGCFSLTGCKITGGTFNTSGNYCGYTLGTITISGNPYFEKPIQINQMLNSNAKLNVTGNLQSNVKLYVIGFGASYYKRVVVSFASGLNAKDYINNFTLTNDIEQYGLYADVSANTLNASKYVKVTFNGGDLVPNSESKTVLYGDTYGTLPGASGKGGYKFSGWRMASGKLITETTVVPTYEDHTLYANASKVYMMKDWSSKNTNVDKTKILSVEFVSSMPTTGTQIDISGNLDGSIYLGDGSVYAYYIANGDNYDVKIYSPYYLIYAPQDCSSMFSLFTNVASITFNNLLNTSDVVDLNNMFNECSSLTEIDLSSFITNNVTDMASMFRQCGSLVSVNLMNFNFENMQKFNSLFNGCSSLTTIISNGFITSNKLTQIAYMFKDCSSLTNVDISGLNCDNVSVSRGTFMNCSLLAEIDMSNSNFSNVTDILNMLKDCTNLTMFKAPYGKPGLAITLPDGTWKNLNNLSATVGTTAYADGGVYVKYDLEEASYLNKNWYNILKAKEAALTRRFITSISFKTSSTFTSFVDVSSSLVYNICGESDYQYDCYPVTLYYSKSGSNYILEFVSSKTIYMPTDSSMLFADFTNLTEFVITGGVVEMASIANADYMFSRTALTTLNLADLDFSGLSSADGMLNISTLTQISTPKTLSYKTNINLPNNQFYSSTLEENGSYKGSYDTINQQNLNDTIKLAYQIYFSANGANNESCIRIVFAGESIKLYPIKLENGSYTEYSYTRTGYILQGWATSNNGTKVYSDGETIAPTSNIILYAIWSPIRYHFNYDINGGQYGVGNIPDYVDFDEVVSVAAPTKTGYTFIGWTANIDENNIYAMSNGERWSGKTYSNGQNLKNLSTIDNGAVTLTAHFEKIQGSVVARIDNQEFASLKLAVDYANSQTSGTFIIYLLKSNKETADITVNAGVTLNLVPQSTSEVQFELGTGSITNNGSLTLGYDDSMTYTDADGNALSKADLSGRFTLSSTGTTIYSDNELIIYDCKIVSGVADVKTDGKLYIKGSPIFTKGIYVVNSNLYVIGTLSTTVPVVLNDKDYFEKKGQVIVNSMNDAKASNYVYNLNITGFSEGYTSKVDTTNSIVIAKISTLTYLIDGNVVDTESYIEGEQHVLKSYSKEGYAFYGWYTEDPTGKMSTLTPISILDSSVTGDYKVYGKTLKYGERGVEGYSDSTLNINVNYDENLNASSVYGIIIVEYFDEDLGVNKVYTYNLRKGTISIKGLRYATYKITVKTTLKASSDVKEYSVRTSSNTESNVNINLTKVNKGGITSSETI